MELKEERLPYSRNYLPRWVESDKNPDIFDEILPRTLLDIRESIKDRKYGKRKERYFSEAYVARSWEHSVKDGWYGSYHWLCSGSKWGSDNFRATGKEEWQRKHKESFNKALQTHLKRNLSEIREIAAHLNHLFGDTDFKEGEIKEGPDLFLLKENGRIDFIEAKHNEPVENHQIATLAILKSCLNATVRIVRVFSVDYPVSRVDVHNLEKGADHSVKFSEYYQAIENYIESIPRRMILDG